MKNPSLRELQEWMRWLITDPRGVERALLDPNPAGLGPRYRAPGPDLSELFRARDRKEMQRRLSVHAEGYFSRMVDALACDFPSLARVLGEDGFQTLVHEYLKVHPSNYYSINEAGRNLAAFVGANAALTEDRPGLADLARLEWLMVESFYAPAAPALTPERLPPQNADWPDARLQLAPGMYFLETRHAIDRVRLEKLNRIAQTETPGTLLIRRQSDGFPVIERLDPAECICLRALQRGDALGFALAEVAARAPETEPGAIAAWFQRWISLGLISDIVFPPQPD